MSTAADLFPARSATRLLDQFRTPVLLADGDGRVRFANAAAGALAAPWRTGAPPPALAGPMQRLRESGAPVTAHALRWAGDRERFDVSLSPLTEPEGWAVVEFVPLRADWQSGESLLDQHSAVSTLLRGLGHELRNPLAGIRGAAQLLAREDDDAERARCLGIIERECARMGRLLAGFGQGGALRREPVNVHQVAEQALDLLRGEDGDGMAVRRDYDPSLPPVRGDHDALVQALFNLARNARQAGAGELLVRTRLARDAVIGATRHHRALRVELTDDGPGIPEALRPLLFFPMVSGREGGTGMGLAVAQGIAVRHGGLLQFESEPGCTMFVLHLPLPEERP